MPSRCANINKNKKHPIKKTTTTKIPPAKLIDESGIIAEILPNCSTFEKRKSQFPIRLVELNRALDVGR